MNLKEKISKLKIDYKFATTTTLLLIIIVFEIVNSIRVYNFNDKFKNFRVNNKDNIKTVKEINGRNSIFAKMRENINKFEMSGIAFSEKTQIEGQDYVIDLKVPKELTKDDIKLSLKDDGLIVSFNIKVEKKGRGEQSIHLVDFLKKYALPPNNAKIDDITYNIESNRILRIVVPILRQN